MFYTTTPTPGRPSSPACASWPTTSTGTAPSPSRRTAPTILLHADTADDGGCAQVDYLARLLDAQVCDETATGGHYRPPAPSASIGYQITAISDTGHGHPPRACVLQRLRRPRPRPDTWT